jgi:hypothetical protein
MKELNDLLNEVSKLAEMQEERMRIIGDDKISIFRRDMARGKYIAYLHVKSILLEKINKAKK